MAVSPRSAAELLLQAVVDYAIYMLDVEGRVASWNPGAQQIKGYTAEEILGEHFSKFYTSEDRADGMPDKVLQFARANGRYHAEGWRVRKDGSRFWALVVIDAIRDEAGKLIGFAKVTRDLTERKGGRATRSGSRAALPVPEDGGRRTIDRRHRP